MVMGRAHPIKHRANKPKEKGAKYPIYTRGKENKRPALLSFRRLVLAECAHRSTMAAQRPLRSKHKRGGGEGRAAPGRHRRKLPASIPRVLLCRVQTQPHSSQFQIPSTAQGSRSADKSPGALGCARSFNSSNGRKASRAAGVSSCQQLSALHARP